MIEEACWILLKFRSVIGADFWRGRYTEGGVGGGISDCCLVESKIRCLRRWYGGMRMDEEKRVVKMSELSGARC